MQKTSEKVLFPELSYTITGLLFKVQNELGRYSKERQYGDAFEFLLKEIKLSYEREKILKVPIIEHKRTNIADYVIEGNVVIELKAKPFLEKQDYHQIQRYLQAGNYKLGLIVNFRNRYLKPIRIIRSNS